MADITQSHLPTKVALSPVVHSRPIGELDRHFLWITTLLALCFGGYRYTNSLPLNLADLLHGTGTMPFQARLLTFAILGSVIHFANIHSLNGMKAICCFSDSVMFFFAMLSFRRLLRYLGQDRTASLNSFLLAIALYSNYLLPVHLNIFYTYDLVSVVAAIVSIHLALSRSPWIFLVLLVAAVNRESAVFLALLPLLLHRDRRGLLASIMGATLTLSVYAAIHFALRHLPGDYASWMAYGKPRFLRNLALVAKPTILQLCAFAGFLWIPVILYWRKIREAKVRRLLPLALLILAANFFVGNLDELRVHSEVTAIVALWSALISGAFLERFMGVREA